MKAVTSAMPSRASISIALVVAWSAVGARGDDREPVWAPQGNQIVFLRGDDEQTTLRVLDRREQSSRVIATGDMGAPVWVDAAHVLVSWRKDGDRDLWRVAIDGESEPERLTDDPGDELHPAVSEDGRIAFTADLDGYRHLFVIESDGTERECLSIDDAIHKSPQWSPDCSRIAVLVQQPGEGGPFAEFSGELRVIDLDEATETEAGDGSSSIAYRRWIDDGSALLFTTLRGRNYEICTRVLGSEEIVNLTEHVAHDFNMDPSPDGTKIVWIANGRSEPGNADVWVMNRDGSGATRLTKHPGRDNHPRWSPDGKTIAFLSNRGGAELELHFMTADGSEIRRADQKLP